MLEGAFTDEWLTSYVIDIQFYLADETDQLERDNLGLDDYLQDVIPIITSEEYDDTKQQAWLAHLCSVITKVNTFVKKRLPNRRGPSFYPRFNLSMSLNCLFYPNRNRIT